MAASSGSDDGTSSARAHRAVIYFHVDRFCGFDACLCASLSCFTCLRYVANRFLHTWPDDHYAEVMLWNERWKRVELRSPNGILMGPIFSMALVSCLAYISIHVPKKGR